jgi:hypothetical protein
MGSFLSVKSTLGNRYVAWLRPNFNFSFFPTQDSERLPAVASQQIAFAFGKREKLRLSNREKHQQNFLKISPNKR